MSPFEKYLDWLSDNWDLFDHEEPKVIPVPENLDSLKL